MASTNDIVWQEAAEEVATVSSSSSVPSESMDEMTCGRTNGDVCICTACESTRTRLLHRLNATATATPFEEKKRLREEDSLTNFSVSKKTATAKHAATTTTTRTQTADDSDNTNQQDEDARLATMTDACRTILSCIGEDETREGLLKTPERWAKALLFMCSGYQKRLQDVTNDAVFSENHHEMIVVRDIDVHSLCEHHMVPFTGRVHIGYIPKNGRILGLSKLARIAEIFARRLQVQERLTRQIADAIVEAVEPLGVAVVVECTHFCMVMRGVQKSGAVTTTSSMRGCFDSNPKMRAEFFSIIHGRGV